MIDPEALYRQLGELLISVPDFYKPGPLSPEGHGWRTPPRWSRLAMTWKTRRG